MPRRKRIEPFLLAVVDEDKGTFTIEGPMTDDRPWNNAVCRAQDAGRRVRCFTAGPDRAESIAEIQRLYGWKLVESGTIVHSAFWAAH